MLAFGKPSRYDELAGPNLALEVGSLPGGPNVRNYAISDLCPTDVSEHLTIVTSPAAYVIALDAIKHPGQPADLSRVVAPPICLPGMMPHVDPLDVVTQTATLLANLGVRLTTGMVTAEPPLACYVTARCRR